MDDDAIRRAYTAAAAARGADRRDCPSPEALRALAALERHDDATSDRFDHVMACRPCQEEYELLRAIALAERQATARTSPRRTFPMAIAASVIIAIGIGGLSLRHRSDDGAVRGAPPAASSPADEVALSSPPSRVAPGDSLHLVWHRVRDAEAYRVELLDTNGALLHTEVTSDTSVAWAPALLPAGTTSFDWLVVATRADGASLRSALHRVQVAP